MDSETTTIIPDEIVQPSALEAMQRADVDIQIATARKYPRNLDLARKRILNAATRSQETAEACFYSLPRGGKVIQGPSVRLAEIVGQNYGNLRVGARIMHTVSSGEMPHVTIQAVVHDLESNYAVTVEKRRRITKKKSKANVDEDDINLATNACTAIAFRDAIFKVVPLVEVLPIFEAAKKVAVGDLKSLVARRNKMVESFGKMGVTPDRILAVLEKSSLEDVTLEDLETLIGLHNGLRDGQFTIEEAFPPSQKPTTAAKRPERNPADNEIPGAEMPPTPTTTPAQPAAASDDGVIEALPEDEFPALMVKLTALKQRDDVSDAQLLAYCVATKLAKPNQQIDDLATAKLRTIINTWKVILPDIQKHPKE